MNDNKRNTSLEPDKMPIVETFTDKIIFFCINSKFVLSVISLFILVWAVMVAPFDWNTGILPRFPMAVDAIPDIGENQQIVFTEWPGRSPQDVEDQISYPLTTALLGVPGVKTIRSYSMFGFSMVYILFDDSIEFYWSRSRVLEKLNSLPANSLPENVSPALGPDATALGQVYWYTIEGRDTRGKPTGGWDLHELRTIQDWHVRYALQSVEGVSEVASVGGFVQEYQIDVSPGALRAHQVKLEEVFNAVKNSNADVGARTIEVNKVEYVIRGRGLIRSLEDIENTVIKVVDSTPVYIKNVANIVLGPALRRGALDKNGSEATGGVVVVRYGDNPMTAIKRIEKKIVEIAPGMAEKVLIDYHKTIPAEVREFARKHDFNAYTDGGKTNQQAWMKFLKQTARNQWPEWVTLSKATVVPFYNRTSLINETLGTLNKALIEEILVTVIVILILLMHFRSSLVISLALPVSVLMCFIAMKTFRIDANIVALSGIAIAIGTIVDMSIIVCENIIRHLNMLKAEEKPLYAVYNATREVSGAVITAVLTTIVSFLPVFTMIGPEGKLFKPLAFTNVFALTAAILIALTIVPALAHFLFSINIKAGIFKLAVLIVTAISGIAVAISISWWAGTFIIAFALFHMPGDKIPVKLKTYIYRAVNIAAAFIVLVILARHWQPLGQGAGFAGNLLVAAVPIAGLLMFFMVFRVVYTPLLRWMLYHKLVFMILPLAIILAGVCVWLGFGRVFGWMPDVIKS
ncbi:MAG: efflux RND transporter permease subunit, partial [Victivallales bacterium]|nr:efflux RND transporter permease subunit [Victivallales bacterium]